MDKGAPAATFESRSTRPFYVQLWFLVLMAMAIGVALGQFEPDVGMRMEPLGDAFIKAIRVLIAPIIFCTVVHGISSMADMAKVGRVALKALIYFEALTTIALIIGLVAVNLFQPGAGMNVDLSHIDTSSVAPYLEQTHRRTTTQFLLNIIPNTFIGAFSEGNVLQVFYVSVLCGFALSWMGKAGKPLNDLIAVAAQMFFRIVAILMWAAPIGAFGAIAFTVGKFGAGSLVSLGKLLISFYVTCLIFIFAVLWPISHWCGVNLFKFIRYIREELLIVIATTSSETVLPRMIAKLEAAGCEESVVGLVIPTGYSFNLDGTCLYLATAAVFLAQATNTPLSIEQQSPIDVRDAGEIERAVATFARGSNGGLIVTASSGTTLHRELIIMLAARHRLPAVYPFRYFVTSGGLICYGPDLNDQYRRAAGYVDRILKGEKAADLPVQTPTKYELAINLKTAKSLGLTVPQSLLATADEVIE
jgi:aerobic C4-dicarboxylate transport protein